MGDNQDRWALLEEVLEVKGKRFCGVVLGG